MKVGCRPYCTRCRSYLCNNYRISDKSGTHSSDAGTIVANTNPNVDLFYSEFFSKCSNCEAYNDSEYLYKMCIMGGMCMGISSIEVLTHNGVISPSDIQPDAERLCDVERNQTTEHYIAMYQGSQLFYEQDYLIIQYYLLLNFVFFHFLPYILLFLSLNHKLIHLYIHAHQIH